MGPTSGPHVLLSLSMGHPLTGDFQKSLDRVPLLCRAEAHKVRQEVYNASPYLIGLNSLTTYPQVHVASLLFLGPKSTNKPSSSPKSNIYPSTHKTPSLEVHLASPSHSFLLG